MSNGIGHNTLNDISKVYLSQVAEETPGERIDRKSQEGVAKRKKDADTEQAAKAKKTAEFQAHKQSVLAKGGRPVDALDSWHKKQAYERNVRKEENEAAEYLETVSKVKKVEAESDIKRWAVDEAVKGQDTQRRKDAAAERRKGDGKLLSTKEGEKNADKMERDIKFYAKLTKKEEYSSWRTDLREIIDDSPMTDIEDEEEVKEKKVKNKVKTSAIGGGIKIGEAIAEIGGEVLQITEVEVQTQQPNPKQEKEQRKETQQHKQVQQKERQAAQKKRMVLLAKIRALRAGGGADITASYEPEGEHLDELVGGAGTLVRQGVKFGGKKGGRVVQAGQKKAIEGGRVVQQKVKQGNPSKMVGSGRAEKAGAVVGGLAGAVGGGLLDGPLPVGDIVGGIAGSKVGGKIGRQVDKAFAKEESEVIDEGGLTSLKATTYGMPHEKRKAILDKYRKSEKNRGTDTKKGRDAGAIARERLNKEDLDKYDRYNRMIRHKQDKYGKNIIGADYNLENERKAKGWKKKLNKEENEVKEDAASQVNRVLKGIEKDPRAQKSFEKSAKKRKGPGTDKDRAADLKFQSAIDAADTSKSDSSYAYEEVEFAVDYFYEQGINEDGLDLIIEEIGLDDFVEFVLYPDEELMEERAARKMNVKTKKKMPATIASDAEAESKRRAGKTGEYKETPKKKAKVGGPSYTTKVEGPVKKMEKRRADDDLAGAPVKKKVEKAVAKVKPIQPKKEVSKGGLRDKIDSLYKAGVKRHKKAVQPARVLGKGFVRGVKDTAKFAGKAKKALVGERFSNWRDEIIEGKGKDKKDKEELVDVGFGAKVPKSKAKEAKKKMNASVRGENIPGFKGGRLD